MVRRTQELCDTIVLGNQAPWKKYFADDCTFSDEKGRTMDKAKLVADITPLPAGYSRDDQNREGTKPHPPRHRGAELRFERNRNHLRPNLSARYHVTDTWLRRNDNWQIIASPAHRYYEDPAVGKADPKKFADFIGTYELAPEQTRTVSTEGENLFVERKGKREQLFPVEGRILFRYDNAGKVDALIDRRNNEDVVWRKTK